MSTAFEGIFARHHYGVFISRFRHLAYDGVLYSSWMIFPGIHHEDGVSIIPFFLLRKLSLFLAEKYNIFALYQYITV